MPTSSIGKTSSKLRCLYQYRYSLTAALRGQLWKPHMGRWAKVTHGFFCLILYFRAVAASHTVSPLGRPLKVAEHLVQPHPQQWAADAHRCGKRRGFDALAHRTSSSCSAAVQINMWKRATIVKPRIPRKTDLPSFPVSRGFTGLHAGLRKFVGHKLNGQSG